LKPGHIGGEAISKCFPRLLVIKKYNIPKRQNFLTEFLWRTKFRRKPGGNDGFEK